MRIKKVHVLYTHHLLVAANITFEENQNSPYSFMFPRTFTPKNCAIIRTRISSHEH